MSWQYNNYCQPSRLAEFANGKGSVQNFRENWCRLANNCPEPLSTCCQYQPQQSVCCPPQPTPTEYIILPPVCPPRACSPQPRRCCPPMRKQCLDLDFDNGADWPCCPTSKPKCRVKFVEPCCPEDSSCSDSDSDEDCCKQAYCCIDKKGRKTLVCCPQKKCKEKPKVTVIQQPPPPCPCPPQQIPYPIPIPYPVPMPPPPCDPCCSPYMCNPCGGCAPYACSPYGCASYGGWRGCQPCSNPCIPSCNPCVPNCNPCMPNCNPCMPNCNPCMQNCNPCAPGGVSGNSFGMNFGGMGCFGGPGASNVVPMCIPSFAQYGGAQTKKRRRKRDVEEEVTGYGSSVVGSSDVKSKSTSTKSSSKNSSSSATKSTTASSKSQSTSEGSKEIKQPLYRDLSDTEPELEEEDEFEVNVVASANANVEVVSPAGGLPEVASPAGSLPDETSPTAPPPGSPQVPATQALDKAQALALRKQIQAMSQTN